MSSYSYFANANPEYRKLKREFKRGKACARCLIYRPGEMTVDHIIPMWQYSGSHEDTSNWQVLCRSCHLIKTREDGFGVGYIHEPSQTDDPIYLSDETDKPMWYNLRSLIDDTFVSSLDIYVPTDDYITYFVEEFKRTENQKQAVQSLGIQNKKLKKITQRPADKSPKMNRFSEIVDSLGNSKLSAQVHDDDSYLVIGGMPASAQDYTKLDRREYFDFLNSSLESEEFPGVFVLFPKGAPEVIADHALYFTDKQTDKKVAGIAILGQICSPQLNHEQSGLEVIFNPETLLFTFAYRK